MPFVVSFLIFCFIFWHMWSLRTVIYKTMWQLLKMLLLFEKKTIAYGFETAWVWVNYSRVFILGELFLQVSWFPSTLLSSGPTNLRQKLFDCNHTFFDKNPSWNKLQMHFLTLWSLCSYIYECPYWQLKATQQHCVHLFASYSHKQLCVPKFPCLSHGNLSSHIKTKGIHQRSASWLPHQNKISDNINVAANNTENSLAWLHKVSDFISFWFSKHAHKQEIHCYYSIN